MNSELYNTEEYRGFNINWYYDSDPQNPRTDWDNLGHMICWHRRYNLGDKHNYSDVESFMSTLISKHVSHERLREYLLSKKGRVWLEYIEHSPEDIESYGCAARVALGIGENFDGDYWGCEPDEKDRMIDMAVDQSPLEDLTPDDVAELLEDELVMLPVSIYDHSGVSIWLGSPTCMWDSGQVGFMYLTKNDALRELGNCTEENWKERAMECMEVEMEVYNCYISGDVYGFVIEDEDENEIDSCWGYYGDEAVKDQNKENRALIDKEIAHREKINLIINSFSWS